MKSLRYLSSLVFKSSSHFPLLPSQHSEWRAVLSHVMCPERLPQPHSSTPLWEVKGEGIGKRSEGRFVLGSSLWSAFQDCRWGGERWEGRKWIVVIVGFTSPTLSKTQPQQNTLYWRLHPWDFSVQISLLYPHFQTLWNLRRSLRLHY